jgi:hypothetical protein
VQFAQLGPLTSKQLLMEPQLQFSGNSFQIRHSIGQLLQLRWMYHQERLIRKQCDCLSGYAALCLLVEIGNPKSGVAFRLTGFR